MCGIAGQISSCFDLLNYEKAFLAMEDSLAHRGPDQHGEYFSNDAVLLHRRLAIIDLEKGRQPMTYDGGDEVFTLVYNGELYNTDEVRYDLKKRGTEFEGHSDTEVVLKAYAVYGESCCEKFNGIFAFAVWEHKRKRLFFCRDRMGVKPLFYALTKSGFVFASEIKALLLHPEIEPLMDIESLSEIMLIGPGRTPGCGVFKGIREVLPAERGYYCDGRLTKNKYWSVEQREHNDSFNDTVEKVRFLVTDAIKRQLVSDVPVCTFLSGGLDSSIISSVSNACFKEQGKTLCTFSVDYKDNDLYFRKGKFQPNSDNEYIKIMNDYLGCEHYRVEIDTPELVNALFSAVDARDLPGMGDVDASLLLLCEKVREYGKVALSGECADEIFGGYPWYRDKEIRDTDGFPWAQSTMYRYGFLKDEYANKINPAEYVRTRYKNIVESASKTDGMSPLESRMAEMMRLNLDWFMQTLLDRKDRMSMYNSLEVRVPFCDHRIVEYLYSVPWEYKDYMGREKGLLRLAVKDILPGEITERKKSPYPKTHNPAYLQAMQKLVNERLTDDSPLAEFIKIDKVRKAAKDEMQYPWYGQLMTAPQVLAYFIQFDYWLRKYKVRFE